MPINNETIDSATTVAQEAAVTTANEIAKNTTTDRLKLAVILQKIKIQLESLNAQVDMKKLLALVSSAVVLAKALQMPKVQVGLKNLQIQLNEATLQAAVKAKEAFENASAVKARVVNSKVVNSKAFKPAVALSTFALLAKAAQMVDAKAALVNAVENLPSTSAINASIQETASKATQAITDSSPKAKAAVALLATAGVVAYNRKPILNGLNRFIVQEDVKLKAETQEKLKLELEAKQKVQQSKDAAINATLKAFKN